MKQLGRTLGAEVYAQGVTSAEQRRVLERLGCTHLEGQLVGATCSGAAAADLLRQPRERLGPKSSDLELGRGQRLGVGDE